MKNLLKITLGMGLMTLLSLGASADFTYKGIRYDNNGRPIYRHYNQNRSNQNQYYKGYNSHQNNGYYNNGNPNNNNYNNGYNDGVRNANQNNNGDTKRAVINGVLNRVLPR